MREYVTIGRSFKSGGNLGGEEDKPIRMKLSPITYFMSDGKMFEYNTATGEEKEIHVPLL